MLRVLALVFLLLLAAALFRLVLRVFGAARGARQGTAVSRMVKCALCGVFVPEADAIRDGERSYCSREHLDRQQRGDAG